MTQDFDGALLRSFVESAIAGSLGQAARKLGRSQPMMTMHIRRLEDVLGCQLLLRTPRGVILTDKGREFLPYAQRILELGEAALVNAAVKGIKEPNKVRIKISEDIAGEAVLQYFLNCQSSPLQLEIEVVTVEETPSPSDFDKGKVNIFIGEPSVQLSARMKPVKIKSLRLQWVSAPGFDIQQRPLPVALYPSICAWHQPIVRALDTAHIDWHLAFESKSLSALLAAARSGSALIACLSPVISRDLLALDYEAVGFPLPPEVELAFYSRFSDPINSSRLAALEDGLWDLMSNPQERSVLY